jgi:hypothetical protein
MNRFIIRISLILVVFCTSSLEAADIPEDDIGNQQYNQMKCIDENSQVCITDVCPHSEDTDCPEKCQTLAQKKCQQQRNE